MRRVAIAALAWGLAVAVGFAPFSIGPAAVAPIWLVAAGISSGLLLTWDPVRRHLSWVGRGGVVAALFLVALAGISLETRQHAESRRPAATSPQLISIAQDRNPLQPGADSDSELETDLRAAAAPPGSDVLRIVLGTNVAVVPREQATSLVVVGSSDTTLLVLQMDDGGLSVSADLFSEAGALMAQVRNNEVSVDDTTAFQAIRSDDNSTLKIATPQGAPVLSVRYMSPSSIAVAGVFRHPTNGRRVEVRDDRVVLDGRWTQIDNHWIVLGNGPVISLD